MEFSYGPAGAGQPYILSQLTGSYCNLPSFLDSQHPVENKADADAYLARLEGFARALDQEIEVARHDMARTWRRPISRWPRPRCRWASCAARSRDVETGDVAGEPRQGEKDRRRLGRARRKNRGGQSLSGAGPTDRAGARRCNCAPVMTPASGRCPGASDYYRASLAAWATTDKKPEEIHKLGLDIVADHTREA